MVPRTYTRLLQLNVWKTHTHTHLSPILLLYTCLEQVIEAKHRSPPVGDEVLWGGAKLTSEIISSCLQMCLFAYLASSSLQLREKTCTSISPTAWGTATTEAPCPSHLSRNPSPSAPDLFRHSSTFWDVGLKTGSRNPSCSQLCRSLPCSLLERVLPRFVPWQGDLKSLTAFIIHVSHHGSSFWPRVKKARAESEPTSSHLEREVETREVDLVGERDSTLVQ